jgi:hypothetical protein
MFGLNGRQIFILLGLVALLFTGAQYAPAYFAAFQLNDYIRQEVKYAATSRKTPDILRAEIVRKAQDLEISIAPKDIRITRRGPSFTLELDYRWPIDMKVYHHVLVFHTSGSGENFENGAN